MIRLKDIATAAGASPSTVSLILNGRAREMRISEALVETVRRVAKEMNYRPMAAARAVRSNRSGQIGFLVMNTGGVFRECFLPGYEFILGAAERMESEGYFVVVFRQDELHGKSKSRLLKERVVDGVIVNGLIPGESLAVLRKAFSKIVWLDTVVWEPSSSIRRDEILAGRLAARSLVEAGYRKIVWAGPWPDGHYSSHDRLAGAKAEALARGVGFEELGFGHRSEMPKLFEVYKSRVAEGCGFVCYSVMEARSIAAMASSCLGLCPGWSYGLACCDDSHDVSESWPSLSRMSYDRYSAGSLAAGMLVKAIKGSPAPSLTLKGEWLEGSSSKRLAPPSKD